ncbi:MAG TPA: C45 family autoproteolytic acyltransferase/hydrolase [Bryobacteraceae bacterium]|nr:C45 family autoproteolytic acyltransferase/hydrolase [Bryobacteraceae bacterium]
MFRVLCCLISSFAAYAATPLFQASFEKPNQGWSIERGAATPDAAVLHNNNKSLRLEGVKHQPDVLVRFAPVSLTIGKRYELSAWVKTEDLAVRDTDRSPITIGAAVSMASMPFDVHSASVGGTQPWTRLSLKFVASRAQDQVLLSAGSGGALTRGKAWFEGVSLDEVSSADEWPTRDAVQTFGPAYRYPSAGWIYLHIEGAPYERGYQHGHLMAREIPEYLERCAADLGSKDQWNQYRTTANALFLRGFDKEILEEMRGIADGASDAGAKWLNRRIDLMDIVVANVTVELGELASAVGTTATGLEGTDFAKPGYAESKRDSVMDHCSAFAATGPATRDGKMVIGHVTWWPLTLAEQTNVMLDIKPASGHRMLIQSYPGGIESGTDWYQNDAGVVLTETTIRQTPFNMQGTPVAFRARMAIQYGGNVDEVVKQLGTRNNGLYTNEWLIGDAKNNEIAMYELGTNKTKLWRSSKSEWFGGTPGFYWGNNNAKDLAVRLENYPDPKGAPDYIPFVPAPRDLAWNEMYQKYRGQIDEQFAFLAFRTAPLVSASTMDAKIATSDMASRMMVWAEIGKPNQREWVPSRYGYARNDGLYPSGYALFRAEPSDSLRTAIQENEKTRLAAKAKPETKPAAHTASLKDRLWKGWLLPASEADIWFVGGSAGYYRVLESDDAEKALSEQRAEYRGLKLSPDNAMNRVRLQEAKGVLFLDSLRRKMGNDAFLKLMADYFAANSTKTVTAESFLEKAGVSFDFTEPADGPAYLTSDISRRLSSAVLVYGTVREAGANRYAAEQMQLRYLDRYESEVPIYKDFEVSDDLLRHRDVIFVGRPEANSALAAWAEKLGLNYQGAAFRMDSDTHASEREGLVFAAKNPLDPAHMVLTVAGNDALRTVKASRVEASAEYVLLDDGNPQRTGFVGQGAAVAPDRQRRR